MHLYFPFFKMLNYINEAIKTLPAAVKLVVLGSLAAASVMGGVTVKLYTDQNELHQQLLSQKDDQSTQALDCAKEAFLLQQKHNDLLQSIGHTLTQIQYMQGVQVGYPAPAPAPRPN
jgi:hypothetical protein